MEPQREERRRERPTCGAAFCQRASRKTRNAKIGTIAGWPAPVLIHADTSPKKVVPFWEVFASKVSLMMDHGGRRNGTGSGKWENWSQNSYSSQLEEDK